MRSRVVLFIFVIYTRNTIRSTCVNTGEEQFEQVNSFKYLGTVENIVTLLRGKLTL